MADVVSEPHTIVQSWVTVSLVQELKARSRAEGCSVSSLVRDALEENFANSSIPAAAEAKRPAGGPNLPSAERRRPAEEAPNG